MLKVKVVILGLILLVFSACSPKPKPPVKPIENTEVISKPVGIGISKLNKV